ncbi:hypothetical protein KKA00_12730 [bacterium]|nr:hypothetical protein [bacterium]MBU1653082.1 hypothetical protein [bacterium]MBU1880762.1 hypothetical protein [bacterium]
MNEEIFIPITLFFVGFGIAAIAMYAKIKKNQAEHAERMLAIEKGAPLPETPIERPKPKNPYIWGFVLIAFGLVMVFALYAEGDSDWGWGFSFFAVGVAILAANMLHRKELHKQGYLNGPPSKGNDIQPGSSS